MKQVIIKKGGVVLDEVPAPSVEVGTVLVHVQNSCISIGTEMSGVRSSGVPLWKRAMQKPEQAKKVLQMVSSDGISKTRSVVQGKLDSGNPTGYSASGIVIEVGEGVDDIKPGDHVACAGAQCAFHAEILRVPRNLVVPMPIGLDFAVASTVTLGAIALQGVRRAQPTLGESFVVVGLGILGQLTVQMLKANGCRVIGTDLDQERIDIALKLGMDIGIQLEEENDTDNINRLTDGVGADGVIITAATSSNEVISTAFNMCRKKGRVVLVGDIGLDLNRSDFYQKELDFYISTSYGPGRYDNNYEEKGLDYPISYVRWTENRNMSEYLRLISEDKLKVTLLISSIYPLEKAIEAYEILKSPSLKPLMALLSYPEYEEKKEVARIVPNIFSKKAVENSIRIAIAGAGGFAKAMHLPNLQSLSKYYHIQAINSRTGHNALSTAKQFNANYSTTEYDKILFDDEVDAVLIATRHSLHADMVLKALKAGKHVLVEKPLALNQTELDNIVKFYSIQEENKSTSPVLLTGFNRRFSPYIQKTYELTQNRSNPMIINYRMNAGYIPLDHWVHSNEGGGRNIGEACHIYDIFTYLTGSKVVEISAHSITPTTSHYSSRDNFIAVMKFEDGSVATLTYTALGSNKYPKENMEVYVDGKVIVMNDYTSLEIIGSSTKGISTKTMDKGLKIELELFAKTIKSRGIWPIKLWEMIQSTEMAFEVEKCIENRV